MVLNTDENSTNHVHKFWWYGVCDAAVLLYGYWTILCHLTVSLEKNLYFLFKLSLISLFIIGILLFLYKRYYPSRNPNHSDQMVSTKKTSQNMLFWILVFSVLSLTLISHRADIDDNRYINRSVMIADNPSQPILQYDGRHNIPNLPVKLTSKLYSNCVLAGALSRLTGIPAIYFPHLVFSGLAAILSVMAFGRLFRILTPDYWAFALLALFVFLVSDGVVHRSYGNFSLVRLHQGKGILVTTLVPLLIVYALDFMKKPCWRNWILLFGVQVSAIGFSSSALLVAPLTALLALITYACHMGKMLALRRLAAGLLASVYILLLMVGLYYDGQKQWPGRRAFIGVLPPSPAKQALSKNTRPESNKPRPNIQIQNALLVFGNGRFAIFSAFIVFTAWMWAPTNIGRWFALVFPLGVAAVYFCPYTVKLVPLSFYWRIFWILPLPVLAGITLTAPLKNRWLSTRHSALRYSIFLLLLILTVFPLSERNIFAANNRVRLGFPGLKVDERYDIARHINEIVTNRPNVLVPSNVSYWLPTFHHHPYPILARYLANKILGDQARDRIALTRYIDGRSKPDQADTFFQQQLERFDIQVVCFRRNNPWRSSIVNTLESLNYQRDSIISDNEIWVRSQTRSNQGALSGAD